MKKTLLGFASVLIIGLVVSVQPALAKDEVPESDGGISGEVRSGMPVPTLTSVTEMEVEKSNDDSSDGSIEMESEVEKPEKSLGEAHRSEVSSAVQGLLSAAERDGGIGLEVRDIAREQDEAHEKVAKSMDTIESRSWVSQFLFGSDYKSLGELRSALATSENGIERLLKAKEKANRSVSDDIDAQISVLQKENEHAKSFLEEQEGKFSLFGWLVKYFAE